MSRIARDRLRVLRGASFGFGWTYDVNPGKQAPTLCACKVAGAAFSDAWKTFEKYGN